ncbi:MAG: glycine zipper 2TM domain-containing protein [Desulfurella sp.]
MKKVVTIILVLLAFNIITFQDSIAGSFFENLINNIKKAVSSNSTAQTPANQSQQQTTPVAQNVQKDYSCEAMFNNSPKTIIIKQMGKNALVSGIIGGLVGALLGGKNNRAEGAVVGAVAGVAGGALYTALAHKNELSKDYDTTARDVHYNPSNGPYFDIVNIIMKQNIFHVGDYIYIDSRYDILSPEKDQAELLTYYATIYRNGKPVLSFTDNRYMPEGEVSDLFYIPVCEGAIPGNYTLKLKAVCMGIAKEKEVSFVIQ